MPAARNAVRCDTNASFESVSSTEDIESAEEVITAVAHTCPDSSSGSNQREKSSSMVKNSTKKSIEPVNWSPVGCYDSKDAVDKYVASHSCFYEQSRNETKAGITIYYYCNKVITKDSSRCPVKLKIFQSKKTLTFGVSVSTFIHDHTELKLKKVEFSQAMRRETFTMKMQFNMRPKLIVKHLERRFPNEHLPSVAQVRAILREERRIEIPPTVSYGQLIEWCKALSKTPADKDQGFVLDHFYDGVDNSFAFVLSTLRLLKNAANQSNICADGTYKVVWQHFPMIIVGFVDRQNHFHVIAVCVTSNERTNEYRFVFRTIKKAIETHTNTIFEPNVLISDAAPAIRNGFYDTFETATQNVICYVHVLRNLRKAPLKNKANRDAIINDVKVLHKSADEREFQTACSLFIQKWTQDEEEFCSYFQSQWLQEDTQNWYCGYSPFVPAHNNGQEGFNNHVKKDHLMRELLPFDTFKIVSIEMVSEMSKVYEPGNAIERVKIVSNTPNITNDLYREAHEWINNDAVTLAEMSNAPETESKIFIASSPKYEEKTKSTSVDELAAIDCENFDDFDSYRENCYRMVYRINIKCNKKTWATESTCCCSDFYSNFICKHIIGLAFHLNLKKIPKEATSTRIEKNRTRGRSAKAKKALQKQ